MHELDLTKLSIFKNLVRICKQMCSLFKEPEEERTRYWCAVRTAVGFLYMDVFIWSCAQPWDIDIASPPYGWEDGGSDTLICLRSLQPISQSIGSEF